MIDFVKYQLINIPAEDLEQNILLEFEQRNITTEGALIEVKDKNGNPATNGKGNKIYKAPYIQAPFHGLEFKIYESGLITVEGSLHKYWNAGAHNYNDFGIVDVKQVFADLQRKFNIKPENCILRQLEIGVNIRPPAKTKSLLKQCLIHKTDRLKWIFTNDEGNYIQAKHQRHILKIYDKKTHYKKRGFPVEDEVLRIEIKYLKMHDLNKKGIKTLADLLTYGLGNFTPDLLKQWHNVIFYDFKALQGTKYEQTYSNPNYWENLPYESLKYHRANLNRLTRSHPDNIKYKIAELIQQKADFLNRQFTEINPLNIRLKTVVGTPEDNDPNRRFCKVTGLNISMQKESLMLSHTGLKYYYKTDRKIFDEVKRKYLSDLWQKSDHNTQIKQIAKNIRHTRTNQLRKQERIYTPEQTRLFDLAI